MIARHYGARVPAGYIKERSDLSKLGMSIKDITNVCSELGMDSCAVRIGMEHVDRMPLPAILYWQQKHFVVLYKVNPEKGKYFIADPADGKIIYSRDDFQKYWIPKGQLKGLVALVEPNENFDKIKYPEVSPIGNFWQYISQYLKIHRRSFVWSLIISLIIMLADFAVPVLLRHTIDDGIRLRDTGIVLGLLFSQLAIAIGSLVSTHGMNFILTKAGLQMDLQMVTNFLHKLARFPISFFDRKVSSDFLQKISDQSRIKDFLISFPNSFLSIFLSLIVFSALLFHYSPLIFAVVISISILEIGWNTLFLNRRKTLDMAMFHHSSENRNHAYEITNGMADLKINNAEFARISKWTEIQKLLNQTSLKSAVLSIFQSGGHTLISRIKELTVTGISALMVTTGDMTFGIMMTLGYITGRLSQPFSSFASTVQSWQYALLSFQRIEEVIEEKEEKYGTLTYTEPSITLNNVSFKYPGAASPLVIKNLNLSINPGNVIALVGESGCGKSTLIKLMLGFYTPQEGNVTLSGHNLSDINISEWLRHCGVVMQDVKIFSGSIFENITMSATDDSEANIAEVMEILQNVGLKTMIDHLPMGVHTNIGVAGIEMSGGQKQRLMIARALYKKPDILFLDEATSSLDANNERLIVEKIKEYRKGRTIIIAAHRLSTVMNADKIIYMHEGRIIETGTHEQLMEANGQYRRLVSNQLQLSI